MGFLNSSEWTTRGAHKVGGDVLGKEKMLSWVKVPGTFCWKCQLPACNLELTKAGGKGFQDGEIKMEKNTWKPFLSLFWVFRTPPAGALQSALERAKKGVVGSPKLSEILFLFK